MMQPNIIFILICLLQMSLSGKNRHLDLIFGSKICAALAQSKVLVVGAGGIGCQLIKNLAKSGYKHITILDFDSIEITNLNRQFYFRKDHIGKSKSETVQSVLEKIDSSIRIDAINASIYDERFNQLFFREFDVIFSCLDNMKAREYLAAQATRNGKALIDAGTMSYFGQAYSSIRFRTSCHNCNPSNSEQSPAFCTIRSHPQLPVHCATYAKNFYDSFFGLNQAESLSDNLKYSKYISSSHPSNQELSKIASCLFEQMFDEGIREIDLEGNRIDFVRKLNALQAKSLTETLKNPEKSTFNQQQHKKQMQSPYLEDKLWSISEYYQKFVSSTTNLLKRKLRCESPAAFEKDDEDCMTLVLCITNLRTFNFMNHESANNRHKYLTYYQCKDLIGKVFPAIASTNAIAAALQAREAINVLSQQFHKIRYISFGNNSDQRISPSIQCTSNLQCQVCSEKIVYATVICNMAETTFGQLEDFTGRNYFTRNRDVMHKSISIIRSSKRGNQQNREKTLDAFPQMIHNGVMDLSFLPELNGPQFTVHVCVIHSESQHEITAFDVNQSRRTVSKQLKCYFQRARGEHASNHTYQLRFNGGFQL